MFLVVCRLIKTSERNDLKRSEHYKRDSIPGTVPWKKFFGGEKGREFFGVELP